LYQTGYNRSEARNGTLTKKQLEKRPTGEKESVRRLPAMEAAGPGIPGGTKIIHVCDREGGMYGLFCEAAANGRFFPVRAIHNRLTAENGQTPDEIRKTAVNGRVTAHIPRYSRRNAKARGTEPGVRFARFEIKQPQNPAGNKELPQPVTVNVVYVKEEHPPEGCEPIEWFLMTNDDVNSVEQAVEKVRVYLKLHSRSARRYVPFFH
jgi:hypothetical protein